MIKQWGCKRQQHQYDCQWIKEHQYRNRVCDDISQSKVCYNQTECRKDSNEHFITDFRHNRMEVFPTRCD